MAKQREEELPEWLNEYCEQVFPEPAVNFGGAVKRIQALRLCLKLVFKLQRGSYSTLLFQLETLLGFSKRKIREDYVSALEQHGIIKRLDDNQWIYVGRKE